MFPVGCSEPGEWLYGPPPVFMPDYPYDADTVENHIKFGDVPPPGYWAPWY